MIFIFVNLIISLTVAVLFLIILFFWWKNNQQIAPTEDMYLSYFGPLSSCSGGCSGAYICDVASNICRLNENEICQNYYDCADPYICSGICLVNQGSGALDANCPCQDSLICVQEQNSAKKICKMKNGFPCQQNSDCANQFCQNGFCATGFPNGYTCNTNSECISNNCNNGFCQFSGIITGSTGAACGDVCFKNNNWAGCQLGLKCFCNNGSPGICTDQFLNFNENCNQNTICNPVFSCVNTNMEICDVKNSINCLNSVCIFQKNPNENKNACILGMSKNRTSDICLNNNSLACDKNTDCFSGACNTKSVLTIYSFVNNESYSTSQYNGAQNLILYQVLMADGQEFDFDQNINKIIAQTYYSPIVGDQDFLFLVFETDLKLLILSTIDNSSSEQYVILSSQSLMTNITPIMNNNNFKKITDLSVNQNFILIVFDNLYLYQATLDTNRNNQLINILPFNLMSPDNVPYQYIFFNNRKEIIPIANIDVSLNNDVLITAQDYFDLDNNNYFYLLPKGSTGYWQEPVDSFGQILTQGNIRKNARFYYNQMGRPQLTSIRYISEYSSGKRIYDLNNPNTALPDPLEGAKIVGVESFALNNTADNNIPIRMLALSEFNYDNNVQIYNAPIIFFDDNYFILPGYCNIKTDLVAVSKDQFYLLSRKSCGN